ncbi:immunoglobulin domain-containing protein [Hahella aquimaris]|uniref:immunoglobulin domain-containing protein n=1 Tax=Hahella sp. HNIBRBA332 TaxID=3015983 RepID=UPI00273C0BDD|nr:immunoglobulin domain-containing protein [Hahella sp. HNIBRBA332]WLQ11489.1 immunoglobulin domain-containing protein [Hahella sp. HNIBRBA332]
MPTEPTTPSEPSTPSQPGDDASPDDDTPAEPERSLTVSGYVMKGTLKNALVAAFPVVAKGAANDADFQNPAALTLTNADGSYELVIKNPVAGGYLIEATSNESTRMTCDATAGCGLNASGQGTSFGDVMSLSEGFVLDSYLPLPTADKAVLNISALTHLAVALSHKSSKGLTSASWSQAKADLAKSLGIQESLIDKRPLDLVALPNSDAAGVGIEYMRASVVNAAFAGLAQRQGMSIAKVMGDAVRSYTETGGLPPSDFNTQSLVTMNVLFNEASAISTDLEAMTRNKSVQSLLSQISQQSSEFAKRAALGDSTPVKISIQPTSASAYVSESVTLNVSATGTDPIRYQWRKNGVNLPNATHSSLALKGLTLNNSGNYDVVVSNDVSSVTSNRASIKVSTKPVRKVKIAWSIPTTRENGDGLARTELKGFRIYHRAPDENYEKVIQVSSPSQTSIELSNLPAGYNTFAVTAVDVNGLESESSKTLSKTFK